MDFRTQLAAELPHLRRFARALAGDAALADDLVQDCIERAIVKGHLYDPARPLRAWLYAVLRNLFISGLRHQSRSMVVKTVDDLADGEGAVAPEQEHRLSASLVAEALERLPAQHREVIVLVGLEEMSYRDAAEIIGVPVGTIMSRLARARSALRQILEDRGHTVLRRVK
ncbi:sigma-70 family RNA polymerase sigma factor [Aestuariivirga sp.]|uniref:sigma-70 family RNA polymerase sigma factor n=1 Tax=Aestuariivirga sp. TaxID=2650926 RepID=UPI0039E60C94